MRRSVPVVIVLSALTACGARSLTVDEIAAKIPEEDPGIARCQAEALYGSDISDEGIAALVAGLTGHPDDVMRGMSDRDNLAFQEVMPDFINC